MKRTLGALTALLCIVVCVFRPCAAGLADVKTFAISNVIAVQKLVSDKEYTPIAVSFGETAVATNRAVNVRRAATNLVFTANLEAGDQLFVYDHARKGYVSYTLNDQKAWKPETVFAADTAGADYAPADDQAQAWGYGFYLRRKNIDGRADKTIYLAGQVPVGEVTIAIAPATDEGTAKTLIGNPLGADWNLNDTSIVDWSKVAVQNDLIQVNGSSGAIYRWMKVSASPVKYGWKRMSGTGSGVIPAGASFWYVRAKLKSEETQEEQVITFRTGL